MKVVIPTAGLGIRMLPYTKYRNKALLRVDEKAAISHIFDLYKSHEFIVLLGYCGNQIREYCKAAHPELMKHKSIKFIEVDDYESDTASTLYSLSKAQEHLQESFIFHTCDTIIDGDLNIFDDLFEYDNCVIVSNSSKPGYAKVKQHNDELDCFLYDVVDKGDISSYNLFDYIGICKITEYKQFWFYCNLTLEYPNANLSDVHILNKMFPSPHISYIHKNNWIDIGNIEEYEAHNKKLYNDRNILYKEKEDIFIVNNNVIKFNVDVKITSNKIQRLNTEPLKFHTPLLTYTGKNIFAYQYIHGEPLSKTLDDPFKICHFLDWYHDRFYIDSSLDVSFNEQCYQFYIDKTFDRIRQIDFLDVNEDVVINNVAVPSIISQLETLVRYTFLYSGIKTNYHGDLVLDNIIDTGDDYVLIDWRDSFQGNLEFGDYYYDIAKLGHSIIMNHDMLCNSYFTYKEKQLYAKTEYSVDYAITNQMKESLDSYYSWCASKKISISKIKLLIGLIWINMSPLHGEKIGKFLYRYGCYHIQNIMWEMRNI